MIVTMGEALTAFDRLLDDVATWATGSTPAQEQRDQDGRILTRTFDFKAACEALNAAECAIGSENEAAAACRLMSVVQAAQWHE